MTGPAHTARLVEEARIEGDPLSLALADEIGRLISERDAALEALETGWSRDNMKKRAEDAEAEVERLREALERISNQPNCDDYASCEFLYDSVRAIARAALAGEKL